MSNAPLTLIQSIIEQSICLLWCTSSHSRSYFLLYKQMLNNSYFSPICCITIRGGGHSHWKGVWGCAAVMTSFFQSTCRSLAHQFTLNVPLLCPLFSILRKFLHFQPCFGQNSSSLDPNFSKFLFPRPPFFQENLLPRPYILKPVWHTPTKKKLSAPPPPPPRSPLSWEFQIYSVVIFSMSYPGGKVQWINKHWPMCTLGTKTHNTNLVLKFK